MSPIANLQTFNQMQLLHLLTECSHLLGDAYQETLIDDFNNASFEALKACEYLRCELALQSPHFKLH